MSGIDLLQITPHQVSRDMRGYSVLFYGEPKSGKTTTASKFPNHLILATEKGFSAIPGAMAQPINTWGELKKVLRQLKAPEVRERFETIILDTVDLAWDYAEKYVCNNAGVDAIGDIPYGAGYGMLEKEFDTALRQIVQLDYGLVLISHSTDKTFTDEEGKEYNKIVPTLAKRPHNVAARLCDIIGFSKSVMAEDGTIKTRLYLRGTPRFEAGSRFKYIPSVIDFTYDNLVKAINEAIDREMEEAGEALFTDTKENLYKPILELDYDQLRKDFDTMISDLRDNYEEEVFAEYWVPRISKIVEDYLGKGKRVVDTSRDQTEALDLVVTAMKDLLALGMPEN